MRMRNLGSSGLRVSSVGLGCNNFGGRLDQEATTAVVDACFEHGITFFDTADVYGGQGASERALGAALRGRRDDVVLATKFGLDMGGLYGDDFGARGSRRYLRRAVEGSLQRLQTDHVDLLQYHRPDGVTPLEETLTAMHELVVEGKVRYLGTSNLPAWQLADASWTARTEHLTPFVSEQSEYSLLRRGAEAELLPACAAHGVGFLPYFPLASGLLTGKYRRGEQAPDGTRLAGDMGPSWLTDEAFDVAEAVAGFAQERGRTALDVAFAGLLARPEVSSVIAGATRPEQVAANAAAGGWEMSAQERGALDEALPG
ncbi:aldo/keto reductase [uncultured Pseudokineococcus sp.]|uniref:aldo/keto reductase n=1 Tax=uncultured Pseudokineococcus sp. TaxID=1642928 RepID=UPI002617453F|nr:aldo/keto reductase [uncultured Pseudokineococcus sp.]